MNNNISNNNNIEKDIDKYYRIYDLLMHFSNVYLDLLRYVAKTTDGGYNEATLFEITVYLAVRCDLMVFKLKQKHETRESLTYFMDNSIVAYFEKWLENNDLLDMVNQRKSGYSRIIRESNDVLERLHFCLLENIKRSKNSRKIEEWDFESGHIVIIDVFEESVLKDLLINAEKTIVTALNCSLEHLFEDNDDFTQLTLVEINRRINSGMIETKGIPGVHETTEDFANIITGHENQLFGIHLYYQCVKLLYSSDRIIMENTDIHYKSIIDRGEKILSEAKTLLEKVKNGQEDISALQDFEFLPIHGPGLDEMTIRGKLLVEAYEKLFPDRPRDMPLTKEEYQRLLNEAVQYFE